MKQEQAVYNILNDLGIPNNIHTHPPVYTMEEAKSHLENISGAHCKNLFLKDKKNEKYYLVIALDFKKINLKRLSEQLGANRLSFGSEDELFEYLTLTLGSVSVFGIINDINKKVTVVIDNDVKNYDEVNFHPNVNTATLTISYNDFERFLNWSGNKFQFVDIGIE